jgi:ribonucleoside-triphosphate reductase (thioredoxin)
MCCLVETFPTKHDTLEDYLRTLKFAYLYAKTVTLTQTHWSETNRIMMRNRRIGTSLSGIAQFLDTKGIHELKKWLNNGYDTIQKYDTIYSDWLAIPKSIKTTSVKPSGSVSLLAGVTPGLHYPESLFYIRRIRLSKSSPLIDSLRESNYKIEEDYNDTSSYVIEFPIKVENIKRTLKEVSMWEQLQLAAFMQENWADNQVSCTVTFKEDEKNQIKNALEYFQYKLKGISFLPKKEIEVYQQIPYEEITEEEYNKMIKNIKKVNIKNIQEESIPELYCDSESCTIL